MNMPYQLCLDLRCNGCSTGYDVFCLSESNVCGNVISYSASLALSHRLSMYCDMYHMYK